MARWRPSGTAANWVSASASLGTDELLDRRGRGYGCWRMFSPRSRFGSTRLAISKASTTILGAIANRLAGTVGSTASDPEVMLARRRSPGSRYKPSVVGRDVLIINHGLLMHSVEQRLCRGHVSAMNMGGRNGVCINFQAQRGANAGSRHVRVLNARRESWEPDVSINRAYELRGRADGAMTNDYVIGSGVRDNSRLLLAFRTARAKAS
jgi:hypothetical protein